MSDIRPNVFKLLEQQFPPEEIQAAALRAAQMEAGQVPGFAGFKLCQSPEMAKCQIGLLVLAERARKQALKLSTETDQEAAEREKWEGIRKDRRISTTLYGQGGKYAGISIRGPEAWDTEVNRWLLNTFAKSTKPHCIISGCKGSGKTWGAIGYAAMIGKEIDKGRCNVVVRKAFEISETLTSAFGAKRDAEISLLKEITVLVVDDLGTLPKHSKKDVDFAAWFENLFDLRYDFGRPTLCTTNLTPAQITENYGPRFQSRFNESGTFFITSDQDYRKGKSNV